MPTERHMTGGHQIGSHAGTGGGRWRGIPRYTNNSGSNSTTPNCTSEIETVVVLALLSGNRPLTQSSLLVNIIVKLPLSCPAPPGRRRHPPSVCSAPPNLVPTMSSKVNRSRNKPGPVDFNLRPSTYILSHLFVDVIEETRIGNQQNSCRGIVLESHPARPPTISFRSRAPTVKCCRNPVGSALYAVRI